MSWLLAAVVAVAVAAVLVLTVALALLVPVYRERRQSPPPAVLWRADAVRPVSPAAPVTARPAAALPGPRELHIHLYGVTPAQAAAEIAAIRDAGYRTFDQYEGR